MFLSSSKIHISHSQNFVFKVLFFLKNQFTFMLFWPKHLFFISSSCCPHIFSIFLTRKVASSLFRRWLSFWILTLLVCFQKFASMMAGRSYPKSFFCLVRKKSFLTLLTWCTQTRIFMHSLLWFLERCSVEREFGCLKSRKLNRRKFDSPKDFLCFVRKGILMSSRKSLKVHMCKHCICCSLFIFLKFLHNVFDESGFWWISF